MTSDSKLDTYWVAQIADCVKEHTEALSHIYYTMVCVCKQSNGLTGKDRICRDSNKF